MTLQHKIYAALIVAAILTAGLFAGSAWSDHKIGKLEKAVNEAKREADNAQLSAISLEQRAAEYIEKTEYLEEKLTEIQTIAKKQDEELQTLSTQTNDRRDDVRRARAVRSIQSTSAELCIKLAELGHGCE